MKKINKWILFLLLMFFPLITQAIELPTLHSRNIILYDPEEKEILYEEKGDEVVSIASLTKIMTTIIAIENIENLDETVTITWNMLKEVPSDASVAGLRSGMQVTYRDLLYASILPSGADATISLAYLISGSTEEFISLMNKKAEDLGLVNTHFENVTGYDAPNHHSTAKEVLKLLLYALDNDLFKTIYQTKKYTLTNGLVVSSTIDKYNQNTGEDLSSILGSKTGFTQDAGRCMSSLVKVYDKELILITLGASDVYGKSYHLEDAVTVINYLNENYRNETVYAKGDILFDLPVIDSKTDNYTVKVGKDIIVYTNSLKEEDYHYEYDGLKTISYKNKKGDKIGTIKYYYQDKEFTEDIYLEEEIQISFPKYLKSHLYFFIPLLMLLIFLIFIFFKIKRRKRKRKSLRKR